MTDDNDLYRAWLARRDEDAFATLARRHANLVHDVAWRVTRDVTAAEDALQHALLALARDGTTRPADVGVRAWLARAAMSRATDAARSDASRRRREQAIASERKEAVIVATDTTDGAAGVEVEAALAAAAPEDAAILTLRYLHGLEYGEIARVLDVAESTARVRVHRALDAVRASCGSSASRDEAKAASAIAALSIRGASPQAVTAAIGAATRSVVASRPSTGTTSPRSSARSGLLRGAAAAAAAALVLWAALRFTRSPHDGVDKPAQSTESAQSPGARRPQDLAAAPSTLRRAAGPTEAKPPTASDEVPETPAVLVYGTQLMTVRAFLLGTHASIPCQVVPMYRRVAKYGTPAHPAVVATRPRERLQVLDDWYGYFGSKPAPRSAVREIVLTVPDPVPAEIEVGFPARDDPRVAAFRVRALDAVSGQALPDAYFDPGLSARDLERVGADERGRIAVPLRRGAEWPAQGGNSGRPFLSIYALGHAPHTGASFEADAWKEWDATGSLPVRLAPLSEPTTRRARLRFVHADGRPAADAYAETRFLSDVGGHRTYVPLRPDADGRVALDASDRVLLDVSCAGAPVESLVFSAVAIASEGEREIRLPPLTRVRLTIDGAPDSRGNVLAFLTTTRRVVLDGMRETDVLGDTSWDAADANDPSKPGFRREVRPLPGDACVFEFLAPTGDEPVLFVRFEPEGWTPREAAERVEVGRFHVPVGAKPAADVHLSWGSREFVSRG